MNLELRNISVNQALSEETNCYSAKLFKDGIFIADVGNHGHGGPDHQHPAPGKRPVLDEIDAYFKTLPKIPTQYVVDGKPMELEQDLELWCGEQVDNHIATKQMRRLMKSNVMFAEPKNVGKGVTSIGWRKTVVDERHINHVARKHPDAVILNTLPEAVAVYVFRAMSGGDPQWVD